MNEPVIRAIAMEGFKCFDNLRLTLGQLTLITGFNGGGKSTALQPLLLLSQALRGGKSDVLPLSGPLVRLGTAGDIASRLSEREMLLKVEGDDESFFAVRPSFFAARPGLLKGEHILPLEHVPGSLPLAQVPGNPSGDELRHAVESLSLIGAVRIGAEDTFPIPERLDVCDTGHDGRFAPYWFDRLAYDDPRRHFPGSEFVTFRKQLNSWLGSLFPGAEVNVKNITDTLQMHLQFRLSELGSWQRPSNTGYGLTYAFPILVALLAAKPKQVVVIDSPEAHLHPSAQSQMGRILATFANAGVQIIVETHSDHLLNGVRLGVREGCLRPEDLCIHFFKGANAGEHGVISPGIGAKGAIDEWPEGFFDQGEKDLSRLAGWS